MMYLDHGATSFPKPVSVMQAVSRAMLRCANPGRGGYETAMEAARTVLRCREQAGALFDCQPEQVAFTANCTHGLNIAIRSLLKPGAKVAITGFEHNAVTRPLHSLGARIFVAGKKLFDWEDTLSHFEDTLRRGVDAAVITHVSNVFGYILPVEEIAWLCKHYRVPFIIDAAQSAGTLPVKLKALGADFIAMPGHKGLLGHQGTGLLLCAAQPQPLLMGGTGSQSVSQDMPRELPDRLEAGTLNVPGIAGLEAGLSYLSRIGIGTIRTREHRACRQCICGLEKKGLRVFFGKHQSATVSFLGDMDCEDMAQAFADRGIAVRAGLHCAPLAHESAGTLETGTVRVSFGYDAAPWQVDRFLRVLGEIVR